MKAVVLRSFGEPLVILERPGPQPGPGQVRIRLEASGRCHTHLHASHGDWPVEPVGRRGPPAPAGGGLRRRRARSLIDARKEDPAEVLKRHSGAHAASAPAVDEQAFAAVYGGLRRGGKLVMVALPAGGTIPVPVFDTVLNGTSVIGSIVGTRHNPDEVFRLHTAGRTKVIYETRPLETVTVSMAEVLDGRVKARDVFEM